MAFYFIWGIMALVVAFYISTVVSVWRESPSHWPELVVVSVILAILGLILLPVIDEARNAPARAAH